MDLGSRHGTFVNGVRAKKGSWATVRDGDALSFGGLQSRKPSPAIAATTATTPTAASKPATTDAASKSTHDALGHPGETTILQANDNGKAREHEADETPNPRTVSSRSAPDAAHPKRPNGSQPEAFIFRLL
mmetsp:Transcript_35843/g.69276  ORF Transcript_35843/g.69276 Transcript_35843/m.69276 type:complete len:131 (+) Transcript_35843:207-599(+)